MYRLKVVSAPKDREPAVGASIEVSNGESAIGRVATNEIVLASGNVSKKHAVLVVDNTKISVRDNGSSNGTFVNGELTARRDLRVGDKISIGEYVFEVKEPSAPGTADGGNVLALPTPKKRRPRPGSETGRLRTRASASGNLPAASNDFGGLPDFANAAPYGDSPVADHAGYSDAPSVPAAPAEPTSLVGRLQFLLEHRILPYFYALNTKHEWRVLSIGMVALFLVSTSLIGVWPLITSHEDEFTKELERKAKMIAIELAERNASVVASRQDSKADVGTFARALSNGVRGAYIIDLDLKIIAPADRAGQVLGAGEEAQFINQARKAFSERLDDDQKKGRVKKLDGGSIVAVEPIRAYSAKVARNVIVGISAVVIDGEVAVLSGGEVAVAYGYALIIAAAIGLLIFYILYKVTLRPLTELNDQIDQSLRGEFVDMKSSILFEEIQPLRNVVESALQRIPKSGDEGAGSVSSGMQSSDLTPSLRCFAEAASIASAVFDDTRQITYLNSAFEEVTGIRSDANLGQMISFAARDQGLISLVEDLFARVTPGGDALAEAFEFSGVNYRVSCVAFGSMGSAKAYTLTLFKEEGFG